MKKFFFRLFLLLLLVSLGYAFFLCAPFGLFWYSFQALDESDDAFALELHPLSDLVVLEESSTTEAALVSNHTLTYTLSDETLERLILSYLEQRSIPGIALDSLKVLIAPEMLSLKISWKCKLLGYRFYENSVFSEWQLKATEHGEQTLIAVLPKQLHSNHLYSVNLAEYWKHSPWIDDAEGWFPLDASARLNVRELVLQDGAVALTLGASLNPE